MKKFEKDTDFLDLVAAWHENRTISPSRRKELLQRLREDQELRIELAREIEMAGLTRAAQAGEPRWLELEEKLGDVSGLTNPDFEKEIMDKQLLGRFSTKSNTPPPSTKKASLGQSLMTCGGQHKKTFTR